MVSLPSDFNKYPSHVAHQQNSILIYYIWCYFTVLSATLQYLVLLGAPLRYLLLLKYISSFVTYLFWTVGKCAQVSINERG